MLSGAQQGLGSLARIIAPPINNTLIQTNTGIPFFSSAALMGVGFLLALRLKPLLSQQKGATELATTPEAPVQPVSET